VRLGVHLDYVFRAQGGRLSTDRAFILFVVGLAEWLDELVLFGRLDPTEGRDDYVLPRDGLRFVGLPHYPRLTSIGALLRSVRVAAKRFDSELDSLDAVWLFGPHPVALVFAWLARRRKRTVFLGIRQDFPRYVSHRLPSRWWAWAVGAAWGLELTFRLLARRMPTVVLGEELARKYGGGRAQVLTTSFSLVRESDVVTTQQALDRPWDGRLEILSVGRLDPEKNPLLLIDTIAAVNERRSHWHLRIVGTGPLAEALVRRADKLGVGESVELLGYVRNGPALRDVYRTSNVFLHVSWTEGVPLVLLEAQAAGLPIVATDVGGVRAALAHGERGLLVPPGSAAAAAQALERLARDESLRKGLIERGLAHARTETMDIQLGRLHDFFTVRLPSAPETN
jgi:glycosyltransferase involved in cell wall biosynthesis